MKRHKRIVAKDDGLSIVVDVRFESRNGLVRREIDHVIQEASRKICDAIRGLRYTDFGPENTRVS